MNQDNQSEAQDGEQVKPKWTPEPWKSYWRVGDDGNADCGILWEKREGHAYSIARCPRYQNKQQWEADSNRIVACINGCAGIANPAAIKDVVAALEKLVRIEDGSGMAVFGWEGAMDAARNSLTSLKGEGA